MYKSVLRAWDKYWFTPQGPLNLLIYRAIIFILGALFIFLGPDDHPASFFEAPWNPISFYKIFSTMPISIDSLIYFKYLWLFFSILTGLNLYFKITSKICIMFGLFYFGYKYNFGQVYHSVHLYFMTALILSMSATIQIASDYTKKAWEYSWPIKLIQTYVVYVMLYVGLQKLYFGDGLRWAFSESFYIRLFINPYAPLLTEWILDRPLWVSQLFAAVALFVVEMLAPLLLLSKRFKYIGLFFLSIFHVFVHLTYGLHRQFFSQIFCYAVVIPWDRVYNSFKLKLGGYRIFYSR